MGSVYTDEVSRSRIARRLSILPAVIGMTGVGLLPLGAMAVGLTEAPRGWTLAAVSVSLVLATVMSGASFGLYLGLATLGITGLAVGGPPSFSELMALILTLFVVHETVRFSLDARRPSRFGPGLIGGYLTRSVVTGGLLVLAGAVAWQLADREPGPAIWVPIGLAVAALPLFVLRGADQLAKSSLFDNPVVRGGIAAVAVLGVAAIVAISAQARTAIETTIRQPSTAGTTPTTVPPTTVPEIVQTDPASLQRVLVLIAAITTVLVLGVLYLALRRPEALFELDELDADIDDNSFGLALPGQADMEDEIIEVDDHDLARMLENLELDIAGEQDPGRAIRFGYANIERTLGELRLTKDDAETEREFLARAMPTLGSAGQAMTTLTRLFEHARFGHDQMDEAMRQRALAAVVDLQTEVNRQIQPAPTDLDADTDPDPDLGVDAEAEPGADPEAGS